MRENETRKSSIIFSWLCLSLHCSCYRRRFAASSLKWTASLDLTAYRDLTPKEQVPERYVFLTSSSFELSLFCSHCTLWALSFSVSLPRSLFKDSPFVTPLVHLLSISAALAIQQQSICTFVSWWQSRYFARFACIISVTLSECTYCISFQKVASSVSLYRTPTNIWFHRVKISVQRYARVQELTRVVLRIRAVKGAFARYST